MAKAALKKRKASSPGASRPETGIFRIDTWPQSFWLKVYVILAVGTLVWWPALPGDWDGDDDLYLAGNPLRHDPAQLWKTWFAPGSFIEYYPITETVQIAQWHCWGHASSGYVLTNIILHLLNALLVWRLLAQFRLRLAWLGGLLFAVHPLTVESVSWISELKNTLSLAPFLLAMSAWMQFEDTKSRRDYLLALAFFVVAMLCKISMAPFAFVILLYAWWKRGRITLGDVKACAPFLLIALVLGATTYLAGVWFARHYAQQSTPILLGGPLSRVALVGLTSAFYFGKFFWPWMPLPIYPQWSIDPPAPWQFLPWLVLVGMLYMCWIKRQTWGRHVLLGLGYFFLMLAPFLGFHAISFMTFTWVMDHFLYLPMIGLIGLVVAGMENVYIQLRPQLRPASAGALALLFLALAWATRSYAQTYSTQESLYTYAAAHNPDSFMVHANLGGALLQKGDVDGALREDQKARDLNPQSDEVHFSLGTALMQANRWEEARAEFQEAIRLVPKFADAYDNLGATLQQLGRPDEAIAALRQALQITDFAQAHNDLGNVLLQTGRTDEAIAEYRKAVALSPDEAQVHDNLALALFQGKYFPEAIAEYQAALAIDPQDDKARQELAKLQGATTSSP